MATQLPGQQHTPRRDARAALRPRRLARRRALPPHARRPARPCLGGGRPSVSSHHQTQVTRHLPRDTAPPGRTVWEGTSALGGSTAACRTLAERSGPCPRLASAGRPRPPSPRPPGVSRESAAPRWLPGGRQRTARGQACLSSSGAPGLALDRSDPTLLHCSTFTLVLFKTEVGLWLPKRRK